MKHAPFCTRLLSPASLPSRERTARAAGLLALAILALLAAAPAAARAQAGAGRLDIETIMQDQSWVSSPPSGIVWSEDSRFLYFQWDRERTGEPQVWRVPAAGGEPEMVPLDELLALPAVVRSGYSGGVSLSFAGVWDEAHRRRVFTRDGDLWIWDARRGEQTRLTFTTDAESSVQWSADEERLFFTSGTDHFSITPAGGELRQWIRFESGREAAGERGVPKTELQTWLEAQQLELFDIVRSRREAAERSRAARERFPNPERPLTVRPGAGEQFAGSTITSDGRFVPYLLYIRPRQQGQRTIVPDYVTEDGFVRDRNSRTKVGEPLGRYRLGIADTERDTSFAVDLSLLDDLVAEPLGPPNADGNWKEQQGAVLPVRISLPQIGPDNRRGIVEVRSLDNKDRFLLGLELESGRVHLIDHQHDDAWIGGPVYGLGWMPDGESLWYLSEKTGYAHLYVKNFDGSGERALTAGAFEIYNVRLDEENDRWFFAANDTHPGVRHFYSMPLAGGEWTRYTSGQGAHNVSVSPDGHWLADLWSRADHPAELYVKRLRPGDELVQVTESTSPEWRSCDWIAPPVVTFAARDGATVYARLYRDENWQPGGPAVIFVHGAGYLQNAHTWWSSYQREYMFHHFLMQEGYLVLDIDYRGSAGYGRDWRTGIYRWMGDKDLTDQVDGARWLIDEYDVDPDRIGIYGGSYGGFMTLMAMFTTDTFAAGAALRPVTDWAHYNHGYTANILNVPQADSVAYARSSPIYHAEGLDGALLICHGLVDTNVHPQDSIRLAQRLIELRKENWELALYPVEGHGFTEPTSWMDEYKRIFKLFEIWLK